MSEITNFSRRDFLNLSALGLGALGLSGLPERVRDLSLESGGTEEARGIAVERLEEYGLEEYLGVYEQGKKFLDTFGMYPYIFGEVVTTLKDVVEHNIKSSEDEKVVKLREGWGEKKDQAVEDARLHALEMEIDDSETGDDDAPLLRNLLYVCADAFPALIMALPDRAVSTEGGGWACSNEVGLDTPEIYHGLLETLSGFDRNVAASVLIHEATHEIEAYWDRVKPYLDMKDFISYVEAYLDNVYSMSLEWVTSDRVGKKLNKHHWFDFMYEADENDECIGKFIEKLHEMEDDVGLVVLERDKEYTKEEVFDAWLQFIRMVGHVVSKLDEVSRREYFIKHRSTVERVLVHGVNVEAENEEEGEEPKYLFAESLFKGVGHFLIGPVESKFGLLAVSVEDVNLDDPEIGYLMRMQQARLESFSTIKPDYSNYSELQEIVEALELSDDPEEDLNKLLYFGCVWGCIQGFLGAKLIIEVIRKLRMKVNKEVVAKDINEE